MRRIYSSIYSSMLPAAAVAILACKGNAQNTATASSTPQGQTMQGDMARPVASGGVTVSGWTGQIDPSETKRGGKLTDTRLVREGKSLHATTGPAVAYWDPSNTAKGDYTVKASFTEPKYMNLNDHPHPYGVFIGGNDMGTANQSYLYCSAYGNGNFIVRGFGPDPFQLNGRGQAHPAVRKASGPGSPVTQDIALSVKGDDVTCSINGAVVGTYKKADVVAAGKLKSTDGVYGIRFSHNTEATVTGLTVTKP